MLPQICKLFSNLYEFRGYRLDISPIIVYNGLCIYLHSLKSDRHNNITAIMW